MKRRTRLSALLAAWLALAPPVAAQVAAQPAGALAGDPPRGWLDTTTAALGDAASSVGATLRTAGSFLLPEAPFDFMPQLLQESDLAFIAMMQSIGLTLAQIETGGSPLAEVRYRFIAAREPSAADYARVRRGLALHERRHAGLRAVAQRRIMQTVIEAGEGGEFHVTMLEITVRPWPAIRYVLAARDRPLDDAGQRLLEALRDSERR